MHGWRIPKMWHHPLTSCQNDGCVTSVERENSLYPLWPFFLLASTHETAWAVVLLNRLYSWQWQRCGLDLFVVFFTLSALLQMILGTRKKVTNNFLHDLRPDTMKENHKRKRGEAICCNKCAVIFILYQSPVFTNMVNICSMIIFSMLSLSQKPVCNKLKTAQIIFNSKSFSFRYFTLFYSISFRLFRTLKFPLVREVMIFR